MRSRKAIAIGVATVIAAMGVLYAVASKRQDHAAFQLSPSTATDGANSDVKLLSRMVRGASPRAVPASITYRKRFLESHDYWAFVQSILPAARAGDADAQFFMWKALEFCKGFYEPYFRPDGNQRSLDETLQDAAKLRLPMGYIESIYGKCQALQEHDVGNAMDWLAKATEQGQPAAQATTAAAMLEQQRTLDFVRAGAAATPQNSAAPIGDGAVPTELLYAAVQSGDPEALFNIGLAEAFLNPNSSDGNTERLAWMLVACERGFDCSPTADWVMSICSRCDTSSPVNMVRSSAGAAWPSVQERAQDISAKLDAGEWGALGFSQQGG